MVSDTMMAALPLQPHSNMSKHEVDVNQDMSRENMKNEKVSSLISSSVSSSSLLSTLSSLQRQLSLSPCISSYYVRKRARYSVIKTKSFHISYISDDDDKDGDETTRDASHDLKKVINAIDKAILSNSYCKEVKFDDIGHVWDVFLPLKDKMQDVGLDSGNFCIRAVLFQGEDDEEEDSSFSNCNYNVEMSLVSSIRNGNDDVSEATQTIIKTLFNNVGCALQKEIARLGFPYFPEGNSGKAFRQVYQIKKELNTGSFSTVYRAKHRHTGAMVAVKSIFRPTLSPQNEASLFNEVAILSALHHPHIVRVYDFFEEKQWYLIILEYMSGGDLFSRIGNKTAYSEQDARDQSKALLDAISYCHRKKNAHLDLKSKNLLFKDADDERNIKIADFGFAQRVTHPNSLQKQCGTPFFIAPEIILKKTYDQRADMWSTGVIIYLLLSGNLPFRGKNINQLFRKIVKGAYDFPDETFCSVSHEAKEVVKHLLLVNPDKHWTACQALNSAWLREDGRVLARCDLRKSALKLKSFPSSMQVSGAMFVVNWVAQLNDLSSEIESDNNDRDKVNKKGAADLCSTY